MIIIDNLFTTKQIEELKSVIQNDIKKYDNKGLLSKIIE